MYGWGGGAIGLSFQLKEIVIHNAAGFIWDMCCLQHPDKAIDHFNNETKLKITSFQILAKPVAGSSDVIAPPEASPVRLRRPQARDGARGRCLQKEIPACTFLKSLEVPRLQVLLPFMMNRADFPFVSCLHFQHNQPFIILLATSPRACVQ